MANNNRKIQNAQCEQFIEDFSESGQSTTFSLESTWTDDTSHNVLHSQSEESAYEDMILWRKFLQQTSPV